MRPLTDGCPKPLLRVNGKALIVYHLEALKRAGIASVVINHCWLGEQIEQALGDGSDFGLHITYSHETEPLETAGGILHALDKLEDEFIVVNGDVFTAFDFSRLCVLNQQAHLVLVPNPAHHPAGDFGIDQGWLTNQHSQRHTFSGIACYKKTFFDGVTEGKSALAPLLRAGAEQQKITAELYQGLWCDVGNPHRLQQLQSPAHENSNAPGGAQ